MSKNATVALLSLGLIAPLAGCIRKNETPADQLFAHKIQCAQQAREYWKMYGDYWGAGEHAADYGVKAHTEWYTYSPKLNTCVVYAEQYSRDDKRSEIFIDVLTGRKIDGLGPDDLAVFREANIDTDGAPKR